MNAGGFILVLSPKTERLLLGKRNTETEWYPDTWFAFGGTMEEGETPKDTAIREFFEETKITPSHYDLSDDYIFHTQNVDADRNVHDIYVFLATTNCEIFPEIDFETQDWKWVGLSDLPKLKAHPILFQMFTDNNCIEKIKKALLSY